MFAFSALHGFDGIKALEERAAGSLTVRRAQGEPVLPTLRAPSLSTRNSNVGAAGLSRGSSVFQGLIEASDATISESTFTRALGVDDRVAKGVWRHLRYGRQLRADGTGEETSSLLLRVWSPSALPSH